MALFNKSVLNQRVSTYFEFLFIRKNRQEPIVTSTTFDSVILTR